MKREVFIYKKATATAANGSEYPTTGKFVAIFKARTIQDVRDHLDKRVNYSPKSNKKIEEGEFTFFFHGKQYTHEVKAEA